MENKDTKNRIKELEAKIDAFDMSSDLDRRIKTMTQYQIDVLKSQIGEGSKPPFPIPN